MSSPIAFIIGSGGNVGKHTAIALKAKGYKVALGSRKPAVQDIKNDGYFPVTVDAESVESIKAAFATITAELGPPNVVIFNAATFEPAPNPAEPLTLSVESFTKQTAFAASVFAAAQEALVGFRSDVHKDASKTFIVTGNPLPWLPVQGPLVPYFTINLQKTVLWRLTEYLASAYSKENIRFYYATITSSEGGMAFTTPEEFYTTGPQHAQVYLDLITRKDQAEWDYRFDLEAKHVVRA
ncbi:hypothetical protein B0H11DRAFT_2022165 [Mycena galericulata]|nr:hypothetical protein B0H11DRAFT_2022165 [Mycena galericulata]